MPNAFVTGSQVYGTPTEQSDIDLCVTLCTSDANLLRKLADACDGSTGDSLRFGKLNLLILGLTEFAAWDQATTELCTMKPVTREKAVEVIEAVKGRS